MAAKRYSANWNQRTDLQDQLTPNVEYASDFKVIPAGEFKPAPWLPIQWTEEVTKDAFVISRGKVVAFTSDGLIVPAGLREKFSLPAASVALSYTATDVAYGVQDLVTGEKVTAAVSYTALQVAQALVARGLATIGDGDVSADADCDTAAADFISLPVGVASYDVYVWAGEEGETHFHNYRKQHLVSFVKQTQLIAPVVAVANAQVGVDPSTVVAATFNAATKARPEAAGEVWLAAQLALVARYAAQGLVAATPVVAIGLNAGGTPVAAHTTRTPVVVVANDTGVNCQVRQVSDVMSIKKVGDWFLDAEVGVLFLSSATWTALATETNLDIDFYTYASASATAEKQLHVAPPSSGKIRAGDRVGVDSDSNLIVLADSAITASNVLGYVTSIIHEPKGLLDKVKTAWSHAGADAKIQMPGSANGGFSAAITGSAEKVADKLVVVFLDVK